MYFLTLFRLPWDIVTEAKRKGCVFCRVFRGCLFFRTPRLLRQRGAIGDNGFR